MRQLNLTRAVPPRGSNQSKIGRKEKLFLCDRCNLVWELVGQTGHVASHLEYYPNLPRLFPKKTCPECKGE